MIQNKGFLKFVHSKGHLYVYLAKGIKENGKKKTITTFGFGKMPLALEKLYSWRNEYETKFPQQLMDMGYNWNDLHDWILSIETGYSKTGRKLKIGGVE
ncbi:hypothetical protein HPT25_27620 [Bacillus sp. BRMEA1]|uniref:hypothetical protein n=1 Tax=Neobacillus endophyticus TaxID=2738405 RepID=UPI001565B336|nr:hypothetical protein [Neobacillus endophyticus]NRD81065.1 hypothetical protein [Neobacillus endophyticus]